QEPVTQPLSRAVSTDRVAHAYLFCGPRGTGKTSTARILAKAVNCTSPVNGEPDDECDICKAITEGRALDLIEIDAASNRGIDDIRNLRERVNFSPNETKFKVYIVDEVHMLTKEAFNALLKTLEEPPPHAIFILATTEAHKIPATIISRCQRFDFRRISLAPIIGRLKVVCEGENVEAETQALELIAKTSAGGLRDAINLLEQAIVSYGSPLTEQHVRDLLGLESDEAALTLTGHILARSSQEGLKLIGEVVAQGSDLRQLHRATVENLRAAMLMKSGAGLPSEISSEAVNRLRDYTSNTSLDYIVHALKSFSRADMRQESAMALPLELAFVESTLEPERAAPTPAAAQQLRPAPPQRQAPPRQAPAQSSRPANQQPRPQRQDPPPQQRRAAPPPPASFEPPPGGELPTEPQARLESQWEPLLRMLNRQKWGRFNVGALLRGCDQREVGEGVITFRFQHKTHAERLESEMNNPDGRRILQDALAKAMGSPYDIRVAVSNGANGQAQQAGRRRDSNLIRAAQSLGAHVIAEKEDTVEPETDPSGTGTPETDDEGSAGA
ncbi:MAG: DNA polymerase III subunit gamma/tau, partial [Chloroflexi bacterium]|nr:DNA polymerase III subunit gamma/tau [Chloroflexota bacterium]